jgi:predicted DNA-binding transcriptional regulator AlpA
MHQPDNLLTLGMAQARLSLSRSTIYRMSDAGEITLIKLGARTMVWESEVKRVALEAKPLKPKKPSTPLTDWQDARRGLRQLPCVGSVAVDFEGFAMPINLTVVSAILAGKASTNSMT